MTNSEAIYQGSKPFSYSEWHQYIYGNFNQSENKFNEYTAYINNWYSKKSINDVTNNNYQKEIYKTLLKEIVLNFSTIDEKRYLTHIDYDNPLDLDIIIPFFVKKLKNITQYIADKREDIKQSTKVYNFKGSNYGIEQFTKKLLLDLLTNKNFTDQFKATVQPLSSLVDNVVISVEELYDTYTHYFDIDPSISKDNYTPVLSGDRYNFFSTNATEINDLLFIDFKQAIKEVLNEQRMAMNSQSGIVLNTENIKLIPTLNKYDIGLLTIDNFIQANRTEENLIQNFEKDLVKKYMGSTFYYLSVGNTTTSYTSGMLFEPKYSFANILNRYFPSVAIIPDENNLKSIKDIGGFFTPDKLGILNFASYNIKHWIDEGRLVANQIYIFPDPELYGSAGVGNTLSSQDVPLSYEEDLKIFKSGKTGQLAEGTVINDKTLQKYYPYQSREESLQIIPGGVSRSYDNVDFWSGDNADVWQNPDIYKVIPIDTYPIDSRIDDLLLTKDTIYEWHTDIYGNEFALYKYTHPQRGYQLFTSVVSAVTSLNVLRTEVDFIPVVTNGGDYIIKDVPNIIGYNSTITVNGPQIRYFSYVSPIFESKYITATETLTAGSLSMYDKFNLSGRLIIRNVYSSIIEPVSSVMSDVFLKYSADTAIMDEINNNIIHFDIIEGNIIIIQTTNYFIIERYEYDPVEETFRTVLPQKCYIALLSNYDDVFSNYWYNEKEKEIYIIRFIYGIGIQFKIHTFDIKNSLFGEITYSTDDFPVPGGPPPPPAYVLTLETPRINYTNESRTLIVNFISYWDVYNKNQYITYYFKKDNNNQFSLLASDRIS